MNSTAVVGWLMWNTMRLLAGIGLAILGVSVVILIWFMFEVGLAWVSIAFLVGALVLLASFVRRALAGYGSSSGASADIIE
jgi:hypothetical protein